MEVKMKERSKERKRRKRKCMLATVLLPAMSCHIPKITMKAHATSLANESTVMTHETNLTLKQFRRDRNTAHKPTPRK